MTLPAFFFGTILAGLYGAIFHFWRGGRLGKLLLFLLIGWAGFWAGQIVAVLTGLQFLQVGPIYLGTASLFSFLVLGLGSWLSITTRT